MVVQIKALACQLPFDSGIPLSRFSTNDIVAEAVDRGIVAQISGSTVWRWLDQDAIKPWQYRSWIFPRDPQFEQKAGLVLDLYQGVWQGKALQSNEFVISADEKTSIQARRRKHKSLPPIKQQCEKVEYEYQRMGSLNYIAAWDVYHAKIYGHCEPKSGILSFDSLVSDVMNREPYVSAKRVFWIVDNGSSHRGQKAIKRFRSKWPKIVLVHLPVHASWLNQIEIFFSILQRKVLTPNDFASLIDLREAIYAFEKRYEKIAKPFEWKFTRNDLSKMMKKLSQNSFQLAKAA